jgi:HPr kinase/phosphorylase
MTSLPATVHASAVLVGCRAVLIRGPSGSGKSQLALALIETARTGSLPFARLVGDDRIHLKVAHGRLLVQAAEALMGLVEARGLGLMQIRYEASAVIGLVVDLAATDAERLPEAAGRRTEIQGVGLSRLAVALGTPALPAVLAFINSSPDSWLFDASRGSQSIR